MSVMWNALMAYPNPGEAFAKSFEKGMAERKEQAAQQAFARAAGGDDAALEQLMQINPQAAMQLKTQRQQQSAKAVEDHREAILMGAKIVREINPQDQAGWTQALSIAQQNGLDLRGIPTEFDPGYASNLVKMADALSPARAEAQQPSSVREFEYAKASGFTGSYMDFKAQAQPQIITTSDGRVFAVPRTATPAPGGPQPGAVEDGYKFKGGDPADQSNWEKVGGPAASPSGTFPPGGN